MLIKPVSSDREHRDDLISYHQMSLEELSAPRIDILRHLVHLLGVSRDPSPPLVLFQGVLGGKQ